MTTGTPAQAERGEEVTIRRGNKPGRGTPDLIAVIATNHRSGYVYADQLNPPLPKTIAQALAQNNAPPRIVTVYQSDGKTPIGKFVVNR